MEEKKKFDLKAILTADINDLFKKKGTPASKKSKVKKSKLMLKPVVSFDFGNEFIKVVEGRYVNNQLKITNYFTIPTQGLIEDGRLLDVARLSEVVKKSLEENGVKAKHAVCTLNSTQIINRELFVPVVEDEELDTVVRYEIQQFLPINLADYLIQYVVLEEVEISGQPRLKLNVVTFPEKMASSYYELFQEVGLKPYALDVSYNALGKLANYTQLVKEVTDLEGTVAFVDIGAQSIDLNIFKNRNIQFTRLIKSGGIIINERLNQLPDMSIKSAASLVESANLTDEDPASRVLRLCVDEMMYELERVLQFYRNKSVGNQIDHLFILGGLSHLEGLPTYMSDKLNMPVSLLDELNQVIFEKPANDIYYYINAIGAIIRL